VHISLGKEFEEGRQEEWTADEANEGQGYVVPHQADEGQSRVMPHPHLLVNTPHHPPPIRIAPPTSTIHMNVYSFIHL